jgi:Bacterial extracellular solute-binding protein
MRNPVRTFLATVIFCLAFSVAVRAQSEWQSEWEKTLAAAKREGKVVVGIPPSSELRKELEPAFKTRFGFELEIFAATGPQIANRVVTEGNLPVKDLPEPREGTPSSNGYGSLAIIKNPPHPNATKVFINWLLSKEGQEIYSRVLMHGTRRLDVDTKWMAKQGVEAAKDVLTVTDNERVRNYLEDKCVEVRLRSQKFAEKVLQ